MEPTTRPHGRRRGGRLVKFGFIAHPTSVELKRHVRMLDLLDRCLHEREHGPADAPMGPRTLLPFIDFGRITGASGAQCEGVLQYMPVLSTEVLEDPRAMTRRVIDAVQSMAGIGAELVGLGGFTGIVGGRGQHTLEKTGIPVTTGNSLTAYAAWRNMMDTLDGLGLAPDDEEIAVVGYPGSIALVVAKLLAQAGCRLVLVHRPAAGDNAGSAARQLLAYLPEEFHGQVRLSGDIAQCHATLRLYVAASSSGALIDPSRLAPGSVVIDAALPRDILPGSTRRSDVLLIDGGLVFASDKVSLGGELLGLAPRMMMNGCLAETIVLSLEGQREAYSIGRELCTDKVLRIGRAAHKHGFTPGRLTSFGEKLDTAAFRRLRRHFRKPDAGLAEPVANLPPAELKHEVLHMFGKHINPPLREFFESQHIDRVFVSGSGCILTDEAGNEYLDFVAGYGCLNVGHNHPHVAAAIQAFLQQKSPTFVQYVSAPIHSSMLAERLVALAPGDLERVFFSNSGTEAMEAAIKLVRAASTRPRLLYCENGYHGKTLGALSVTGREKHRRPFIPLLGQCAAIAFADLPALERELQQGDVAAFVVEPIQGEGGVIVPPEGYFAEVQQLCRKHGALLVVDEVQTGLGRTGRMFASEHEGLEPDVLVLAKSLSGGFVPIGATLCTTDVWDRAYGTRDRCVLHTSTFGGGNLAAAAGLATLEVIEREDLSGNARRVGTELLRGLREVASRHPFVKEVRGRGLMIAVEFDSTFEGSIAAFGREFVGRLRGDGIGLYRMMSDRTRQLVDHAVAEIENDFEDMFVMRFVSGMSRQGLLSFVTANSNKVMRIQPPLVLTDEQAVRFVTGFAKVCEAMSTDVSDPLRGLS